MGRTHEKKKTYLAIDGDDIGKKILACYINDDESAIVLVNQQVKQAVDAITTFLLESGYTLLFSAADGVLAKTAESIDPPAIHKEISKYAPSGFSFSAGVGNSMREAFLALTMAKCRGKNTIVRFEELAAK